MSWLTRYYIKRRPARDLHWLWLLASLVALGLAWWGWR